MVPLNFGKPAVLWISGRSKYMLPDLHDCCPPRFLALGFRVSSLMRTVPLKWIQYGPEYIIVSPYTACSIYLE